eukprot:6441415-Prymnesium_polylepis.1
MPRACQRHPRTWPALPLARTLDATLYREYRTVYRLETTDCTVSLRRTPGAQRSAPQRGRRASGTGSPRGQTQSRVGPWLKHKSTRPCASTPRSRSLQSNMQSNTLGCCDSSSEFHSPTCK